MDANMKAVISGRIERTAENLRRNNMEVYIAENSSEAVRNRRPSERGRNHILRRLGNSCGKRSYRAYEKRKIQLY